MAKKTENAIIASTAASVVALGKAFANWETGADKLASARESLVDQAYTVLSECKTGADWESVVAGIAASYKAQRKCNEDAAAKAAQRLVAAVRSTFDLKKPQTAEATKKQAERKAKELQTIEACLVSGVGAADAAAKLEKLSTGDNATAEAKALAAKLATQMASFKSAGEVQKKANELAKAMQVIAAHYGTNPEMLGKVLNQAFAKRVAAA